MKRFFCTQKPICLFLLLICLQTVCSLPPPAKSGKKAPSDIYIGGLKAGNTDRSLKLANYDKTPNIRVVNIGLEPLVVSSTYGDSSSWKYHIKTVNPLKPGSDATLNTGTTAGHTCLTTFAFEGNKRRGMYYAVRGFDRAGRLSYPNFATTSGLSFDFDKILLTRLFLNMEVIGRIADKIPIPGVSFALQVAIDIFLPPPEEPSVWDQIKNQVLKSIGKGMMTTIEIILENELGPLKKQIEEVREELEQDEDMEEASRLYVNLAQRLTGLELKFQFKKKKENFDPAEANYVIVPLFVQVINLKLAYYQFGIAYSQKMKLKKRVVDRLQTHIVNTVKDAIKHITDTLQAKVDKIYDENNPNDLYNDLMTVRSKIGVEAVEYYSEWQRAVNKNVDKNTGVKDTVENNAIIYSEYFGQTTPDLYLDALATFGNPPLTPPKLPSKMVARFVKLEIFEPKTGVISGLRLTFEKDKTFVLGKANGASKVLNIGKERITKMDVGGDGKVEFMVIHLSDDRVEKYGKVSNKNKKTFQLKGHYIASMTAHNDDSNLNGHFANIAVSYRLNPSPALQGIPKKFNNKKKS